MSAEIDDEGVEDEPEIAAAVGFWDDPKWRNTSYPMRVQLYEQIKRPLSTSGAAAMIAQNYHETYWRYPWSLRNA